MCSSQLSYPRMVDLTGIEPAPPGISPALSMSYWPTFVSRNTATQCAPRQPGLEARTRGDPKERGQIMVKRGGKKAAGDDCCELRKRQAIDARHSAGCAAGARFSAPCTSTAMA